MNEHFPNEQDQLYKRIYGGIGWPGARPGYICIIGELRQPKEHQFILLDEAENFDIESLIARAAALDLYFKPERWFSGEIDKATQKLLTETNKLPEKIPGSRPIRIIPSRLNSLEDEVFRYVYPKLKRMTGHGGHLDISKGKLLLNYMSLPQDSEISTIKLGEYPSIECLAYVALELEKSKSDKPLANKCIYNPLKL